MTIVDRIINKIVALNKTKRIVLVSICGAADTGKSTIA
jgi:predicted ribonuclease YlaK